MGGTEWPAGWRAYRRRAGLWQRCTHWEGRCACGSVHTADDWPDLDDWPGAGVGTGWRAEGGGTFVNCVAYSVGCAPVAPAEAPAEEPAADPWTLGQVVQKVLYAALVMLLAAGVVRLVAAWGH